ncbi:DUF998 domain-containing protein [Micromonospora sp. WMMA1998]|uniref:DUF998 domain-containing protein n=1 Tax=Micromonospora sp. WMMA1998 TaxID=3015167 RepID=UPI00248B0062|nr:DUF998 domain-containing protein [Micromonospora sp. WMMA1998]WBC14560.1 DUF998 domain-containing protein [Micromonospora sp. WMMA1998]
MADRTSRRVAAGSAAACLVAGVVAVTVALVAGPGPGLTGYVSEAGVTDSGYAGTYRIGVFALAAALLLLAAALPPAVRAAPGLLGTGAVATVLSGAVTCSTGCPLPPFEAATVADLVHGGASIAATAAVVFAMLAVLLSPAAGTALRRVAALGAALALPLSGAVGLAMLLVGRGALVGVLERVLLGVVAAWGLGTALLCGCKGPHGKRSFHPRRDGSSVGRR